MASTGPPASPAPDSSLVVRTGCLALLVTVVHFWSQRHLGVSLITGLAGSAGVTVFFGFLASLLSRVGQREPLATWGSQIFGRTVRCAVSPTFLIVGSVAIFAIGSSFASVRIDATGALSALPITVSPLGATPGAKKTVEPGELHHVTRLTTLFGKAYELRADGFRPFPLDLKPWTGSEVKIPDDLQRQPALLVRLPPAALNNIHTAHLQLTIVDGGSEHVLEPVELDETQASALFGHAMPIPSELTSRWTLELAAEELDAARQSKILLRWSNPKLVEICGGLVPGQQVQVEFINVNGDVRARRVSTLGAEPLQDIILDLTPNQ